MKTTRQLFALAGDSSDIQQVLDALQFKGIRTFSTTNISTSDIFETFLDNKSVVCPICEAALGECPTIIEVVRSTETCRIQCKSEYIDVYDINNIANKFQEIASIHLCDIGDLKSNSSGLKGTPKISECAYCNYYYKGINPHSQKTIYESDNFIVLATLGEFINGYLLIIPKKHILSCAEFDEKTMNEFLEVLDDVLFILQLAYKTKKFLVWENGTGNGGKGKAKDSIVHSHVHVAPSGLTANEVEINAGFPLKKISTSVISLYTEHSYLMIKDGKNWRINDEPSVYIPRQYIRQLIARENNLNAEDIWNWRTHPFIEKMCETYDQINSALTQNWSIIPTRIKSRLA